jgi:aspartate kinase
MLLTIKFGGTSVGDAARIRNVAELVRHVREQGHRVAVVTSAMAGVTNQLVALAAQAAPGVGPSSESKVAEFYHTTKKLEQDHLATARQAIRDPALAEEVGRLLYAERHGLDRVLLGSYLLGELTPIGSDFIVSGGERLCVPVLVHCLRDLGVDAVGLGGDEAGIVTDNNYGNALPNEARTRQGVRQALLPLLEAGKVPVVAGFFGRSEQGRCAILGRGGSDFTATLVGCALEADEIWIMKHEVGGIMTTDPRLVPTAYTLPEVSYSVAAEMALLGAKVLHPKSVQPAARQRVPVRIASSAEPDKPGTRLVPERPGAAPGVTALTLVRRGGLIRAAALELGDETIIPPAAIEALRRQNIDLLASAAGFNGGRVLWLVGSAEVEKFLAILRPLAEGRFQLEVQRDVAVVGIIGERVATTPDVLARVARCLDQAGDQPLVLLQGGSPNGVILAVAEDEQRLPALLNLLHAGLGLNQAAGR